MQTKDRYRVEASLWSVHAKKSEIPIIVIGSD